MLMMAWMNRASLEKTLETGKTHFWSRSRQKFWMKGETSGHTQTVKDVAFDCDGDTLLIQVEQIGAACHEGYKSCFFRSVEGDGRENTERQLNARTNLRQEVAMYSPTPEEFAKLAAQGNLVPVTRRLLADFETPLSAYRKIRGQGESFLFESVEGGEHLGRYSFVGCNPRVVIRQTGNTRRGVRKRQGVEESKVRGPLKPAEAGTVRDGLEVVERILKRFRPVPCPACRGLRAARSALSVTSSFTMSNRSSRGRRRTNCTRRRCIS